MNYANYCLTNYGYLINCNIDEMAEELAKAVYERCLKCFVAQPCEECIRKYLGEISSTALKEGKT